MHVIIVHDPFHPLRNREIVEHKRRRRISSLAPTGRKPFICLVNGEAVLRKDWKRTVGGEDIVSFIMLPEGGGGSNPLRIVLMIAVMYFTMGSGATWLSAYGGGAVTATGLSATWVNVAAYMAGSMLVNALIPPPKPPAFSSNAGASASPTYNLQAQGNFARLEQPIPVHYGRLRVYPDYASQPYIEYHGNEQYLYQLLCIGQGSYQIEGILIEDTSIANFAEVSYEIVEPGRRPTLFPANVVQAQEVSGQEMTCVSGTYSRSGTTVTVTSKAHGFANGQSVYLDFTTGTATDGTFTITAVPTEDTFTVTHESSGTASGSVTASLWVGGFIVNPTSTDCDYIGLDFICPRGLFYAKDDGGFSEKSTYVSVEGRAVDQNGSPIGPGLWFTLTTDDHYTDWIKTDIWTDGYSVKTVWTVYNNNPSVKNATYAVSGSFIQVTYNNHGLNVGKKIFLRSASNYIRSIRQYSKELPATEYRVLSVIDANNFTITAVDPLPEYSNIPCSYIIIPDNTDTDEYQGSFTTTPSYESGWFYDQWEIYRRHRNVLSYDSIEIKGATATPIRVSHKFNMAPHSLSMAFPRFEVRVRRLDAKDTQTRAAHDIVWAGLRGYMPDRLDYGNVTLLAVKARATNNLSSQNSRKINLLATRKLLTVTSGGLSTTVSATRSVAAAIADACLNNDYGAGLPLTRVDLSQLWALEQTLAARSDYFDGRFDSTVTFWEAINQIAKAGRAKCYMQGGVIHTFRDQASSIPVALFSMRNIAKGSFSVQYLTPSDDTADSVEVSYLDSSTWKPMRLVAALAGSTVTKPAKVELFGVTQRLQAYKEALYQAAANKYRRKLIKFSTEAEGFIPSFGDLIAISHDMPQWGQGSEVISWSAGTKTMVVSDTLTWTPGQTHYVGIRKRDGSVDGPYEVTKGGTDSTLVFSQTPSVVPYTQGSEERTHIAFGPGETWRQPARVVSIQPRGLYQVEITAINEDSSVHTADQGSTAPPIVYSSLSGTKKPEVANLSLVIDISGGTPEFVLSWDSTPSDSFTIQMYNGTLGGGYQDSLWVLLGTSFDRSFRFPANKSQIALRVQGINLAGRGYFTPGQMFTFSPRAPVNVWCASGEDPDGDGEYGDGLSVLTLSDSGVLLPRVFLYFTTPDDIYTTRYYFTLVPYLDKDGLTITDDTVKKLGTRTVEMSYNTPNYSFVLTVDGVFEGYTYKVTPTGENVLGYRSSGGEFFHYVTPARKPRITGVNLSETLVLAAGAVVSRVDVSIVCESSDLHPRPVFYSVEYWRDGEASKNIDRQFESDFYLNFDANKGKVNFLITPYRVAGSPGDSWVSALNLVGKSAPPSDVSGLTFNVQRTQTTLSWNPATDLDVIVGGAMVLRYSSQQNATWENAIEAMTYPGSSSTAAIQSLPDGTWLAKWVDSSGNYSVSPAAVSVMSLPGALRRALWDSHPTWAGTKTNLALQSNVLSLGGSGSSGSYRDVYYDYGQVVQGEVGCTVEFTTTTAGSVDLRGNIDAWPDIDGTRADDVYVSLWLRTTSDNPAGSPTWSDWRQFYGREFFNARAFQVEIRVSTDDITHNLELFFMHTQALIEKFTLWGVDVVSGTSTLHVTYSTPFLSDPGIGITPQNMATGDYYTLSNRTTTGFDIIFRNAAGTAISRTFDWVATGY